MKFAISLLNLRPGLIGGAETYIRQLLAHLPQVAEDDRFVVVLHRENAESISTPGMERVILDCSARQVVRWRILEAFTPFRAGRVMKAFQQINPDAILFPQQSIFPKAVLFPVVMSVVDVQHLFFPEYFSLFDRAFRAAAYPRSLSRADRLIAISEYTRKTVIERCGVEPGKITAIPFGLARRDVSAVQPSDKLPRPYLYYPAATFRHKGHLTLLSTFAELKRSGNFPAKLVFTGKQTDFWPTIQKRIAELGLAGEVIHPGFVTFEEVGRIYKGAEAVVFPTQFEGFGLPVIEAVEFGKKVITSRLEVFDEIGVPREYQIDFAKPEELGRALAIEGITRLDKPPITWTRNAEITLDLLRQAAGTRRRGSNPTL